MQATTYFVFILKKECISKYASQYIDAIAISSHVMHLCMHFLCTYSLMTTILSCSVITGYYIVYIISYVFVFCIVDRKDYKVVMVGNAAVGKTALAIMFTSGRFPVDYVPTICE